MGTLLNNLDAGRWSRINRNSIHNQNWRCTDPSLSWTDIRIWLELSFRRDIGHCSFGHSFSLHTPSSGGAAHICTVSGLRGSCLRRHGQRFRLVFWLVDDGQEYKWSRVDFFVGHHHAGTDRMLRGSSVQRSARASRGSSRPLHMDLPRRICRSLSLAWKTGFSVTSVAKFTSAATGFLQ